MSSKGTRLVIDPNAIYSLHPKDRRKRLSLSGKCLLVRLAHFQATVQHVYPSIATLAQDIGASSRTVWRALKELEDGGYIVRESRGEKTRTLEIKLQNEVILRDILKSGVSKRNLAWLHKSYGEISPHLFKGLDIPSDDEFDWKVTLGSSVGRKKNQ